MLAVIVVVMASVAISVVRQPSTRLAPQTVVGQTPTTTVDGNGDVPAVERPSQAEWEALLPRLEQAAEDHPSDTTAQRRLAIALYNLGRYSEAADIYRTLLTDQEDAVLYDRLGNTLREQRDLEGAENAYRRSIAVDASLPAPYVNLAELQWRLGREQDALDTLQRGLEEVHEEARPYIQKALAVLQGDRP